MKKRYATALPLRLGEIGLYEHLAELLELLRPAHLFCKQGQPDDVEELIVELVCFFEVLLLHFVADLAVLAVGVYECMRCVRYECY